MTGAAVNAGHAIPATGVTRLMESEHTVATVWNSKSVETAELPLNAGGSGSDRKTQDVARPETTDMKPFLPGAG